jgi:hypothetical protein
MGTEGEPRLMELTDPEHCLFSCTRGEHGLGWYVLAWVGGLTLLTLLIASLISIVLGV